MNRRFDTLLSLFLVGSSQAAFFEPATISNGELSNCLEERLQALLYHAGEYDHNTLTVTVLLDTGEVITVDRSEDAVGFDIHKFGEHEGSGTLTWEWVDESLWVTYGYQDSEVILELRAGDIPGEVRIPMDPEMIVFHDGEEELFYYGTPTGDLEIRDYNGDIAPSPLGEPLYIGNAETGEPLDPYALDVVIDLNFAEHQAETRAADLVPEFVPGEHRMVAILAAMVAEITPPMMDGEEFIEEEEEPLRLSAPMESGLDLLMRMRPVFLDAAFELDGGFERSEPHTLQSVDTGGGGAVDSSGGPPSNAEVSYAEAGHMECVLGCLEYWTARLNAAKDALRAQKASSAIFIRDARRIYRQTKANLQSSRDDALALAYGISTGVLVTTAVGGSVGAALITASACAPSGGAAGGAAGAAAYGGLTVTLTAEALTAKLAIDLIWNSYYSNIVLAQQTRDTAIAAANAWVEGAQDLVDYMHDKLRDCLQVECEQSPSPAPVPVP